MNTFDQEETEANKLNRKAFVDLCNALQEGHAVAFVGAGISAHAQYPTWGMLLDRLDQEIDRLHGYQQFEREFIARDKDLLWRAQEYCNRLQPEDYFNLIQGAFPEKPAVPSDDFYQAFIQLPFAHILTTNYDRLLECLHEKMRSGEPYQSIDWSETEKLNAFIRNLVSRNSVRYYVHVHGTTSNIRKIIFTETDYVNRYVLSEDARKKLFAIFATQRVVFLGFSLEDPELVAILREVNAFMNTTSACHFAVLPLSKKDESPNLLRRRLNRRYGIEPVFFPRCQADFSALTTLIQALAKADAHRLPLLEKGYAWPLTKHHPPTHFSLTAEIKEQPVRDESQLPLPITDPDDPQRGRWGGLARYRGRELTAAVTCLGGGFFRLILTLAPLPNTPAIKAPVRFHLHNTFNPDTVTALPMQDGSFQTEFTCYGAFTVGAELPAENLHLELNLAADERFPLAFRTH